MARRRKYPDISWRYLDAFDETEQMRVPEEQVQKCVVAYLQETYPAARFKCDTSAIKLTIGQARNMKRLGNTKAWPDLFIANKIGKFSGCFIELKKYGESLTKRNGDFASEHIGEQVEMLNWLYDQGYCALMVAGWKATRETIDWYLAGADEAKRNGHTS